MLEIASDVLLILTGIFICLSDIRWHRVPNLALLIISLTLVFSLNSLSLGMTSLILILIWSAGLMAKIGMGDLKLLTILTIFQGETVIDSMMWILTLAITAISLLIHLLRRRSLAGDIPLAPAIVIPFIALYLSN